MQARNGPRSGFIADRFIFQSHRAGAGAQISISISLQPDLIAGAWRFTFPRGDSANRFMDENVHYMNVFTGAICIH